MPSLSTFYSSNVLPLVPLLDEDLTGGNKTGHHSSRTSKMLEQPDDTKEEDKKEAETKKSCLKKVSRNQVRRSRSGTMSKKCVPTFKAVFGRTIRKKVLKKSVCVEEDAAVSEQSASEQSASSPSSQEASQVSQNVLYSLQDIQNLPSIMTNKNYCCETPRQEDLSIVSMMEGRKRHDDREQKNSMIGRRDCKSLGQVYKKYSSSSSEEKVLAQQQPRAKVASRNRIGRNSNHARALGNIPVPFNAVAA